MNLSSPGIPLTIVTHAKQQVQAKILDSNTTAHIITRYNGKQDNSLRKKFTARTYVLSDNKILLEFYDRQSLLIDNINDFNKLERIRFVKNAVYSLRKNISYKIALTIEEGRKLIQNEHPERLRFEKSKQMGFDDLELYQLKTGQILYINKEQPALKALIYPDLKTLSSENSNIQELVYASDDDEHLMKRLASGDALTDYDLDAHHIYPKYLDDLIKNHQLAFIRKKVFVSRFFGNLYKSDNGYYVLIDEVNQKNGAGKKMKILSVRIYQTIQNVIDAEGAYAKEKDKEWTSEHFYKQLSDKYGERFPIHLSRLIDSLPLILNIDKELLTIDSAGIDLIDEALKWHATNYQLFNQWFPGVLAFYGQCYISGKKEGSWVMHFENSDKVWIPQIKLKDGTYAWDWLDFYKGLYEGPIPLRWVGDWDGISKKICSKISAE